MVSETIIDPYRDTNAILLASSIGSSPIVESGDEGAVRSRYASG
jgi:hypothetical protein